MRFGSFWHLQISLCQFKAGCQLGKCHSIRCTAGSGGQMGKQANTVIGINPLGSRRILRLPLLIISQQTGVIDHTVWHKQRQAARGISRQMLHVQPLPLRAGQLLASAGNRIRQRHHHVPAP